jgi:hypothetical protein
LKQHPTIRELHVSEDGRLYDSTQECFINVNTNPGGSLPVVAYWQTNGNRYTLDVLKLMYETYIQNNKLKKEFKVVFKEGTTLHVSNLRKTKKTEKKGYNSKEERHDSWLQDDIYC